MNDFFLKPFLDILAADGIRVSISDYSRITLALRADGRWNLERLRGVLSALLVKSPEQEELFLRLFESFFDSALKIKVDAELPPLPQPTKSTPKPLILELSPKVIYSKGANFTLNVKGYNFLAAASIIFDGHAISTQFINAEQLAAEVPASLIKTTGERKVIVHAKGHDSNIATLKVERKLWHMYGHKSLLALGTLVLLVIVAYSFLSRRPDNAVVDSPPQTNIASPTPPPSPQSPPINLPALARFTLIAFLIVLTYFFFRWLFRKKPLLFDPAAPRHFHPGVIGGKPAPFLDSITLDHLAGLVGYGLSEKIKGSLDLRASVEIAARNGGLPTLVYCKQKYIKTIYIVEDARAEPLVWNSVPQELAEGLTLRGVPVVYGKFYDSLERFETADRTTYWLDGLETQNFDHLMMVFSDSKSVAHARNAAALQSLARRPLLAWMELREPRFWDEKTDFIASHGIPVYPATSEGTLQAFSRFQTEQNLRVAYSINTLRRHYMPIFSAAEIPFKVERLLGDALPWAQACAMIQPLTLGLADSLRCQFQPHLPAERIGRLFLLPGTTYSNSGLRFSDAVLAALRSGFIIRWDDEQQEDILKYILKRIGAVEPVQQHSLAHLSWQWVSARVGLELDPDRALEDIERLIQTPLGNHIKAEIENIYVAAPALNSSADTASIRIPVRQGAKGKFPWRRLALINEKRGGKNTEQNTFADNHWKQIHPFELDPVMLHSHIIEERVRSLRRPVDDNDSRNVARPDSQLAVTPLKGYVTRFLSKERSARATPEHSSDRAPVNAEIPKTRGLSGHKSVFAGAVAGTIAGIAVNGLLGSNNPRLTWVISNLTEPIGTLFLRLMLMMIVPLVFSSLMLGVAAIGTPRRLARIGLKSFVYMLIVSVISIAIGLAVANAIRPGRRLAEETRVRLETRYGTEATLSVEKALRRGTADTPLMQVVKSIVPTNPFAAVAGIWAGEEKQTDTPNMIHLMFFALFLGVAAMFVPSRVSAPLLRGIEALYEISAKVVDLVMKLAPVAIACLLFTNMASFGLDLLGALVWFMVTVLLGLALHLFGIYSLSVYFMSRMLPLEFFRRIKIVMLTAFSTSSSNATIPIALRVSEENLGVPRKINRFVLTVGAIGNQNGTTLYGCVSVLFLAQLAGVNLTFAQQLGVAFLAVLGGIGIAGVPSGSIPFIIGVLASIGVNPALIAIILGVDRILDMCRTTLNVTGDITAATYVVRSEGYELLQEQPTSARDDLTLKISNSEDLI